MALALIAAATIAARAAVVQQTGQYAASQGKPQIVSRLTLTSGRNPEDTLLLVQYPLKSKTPITKYGLTQGQPLHVVIVRDDFFGFGHLHPQMSPGGVFRLPVSLEQNHRYYVYVESQPAGLSEQVFRYVLQVSAPPVHLATTIVAPRTRAAVGPYVVSLDRQKLHANRAQTFTATIDRRVRNPGIAPFHVPWVQAVLVNTSTLAYADVDSAANKGICCEYALHLSALTRGLYRMWLQFNDGQTTYTTPFTFAVQ
ncbi:MAG TPA: hypothetical protein VFO29_00690 [Candidatus Rubrimentiphilum sp.]|nr:hypothetical protein [Candidatus Rubrimentiphilum sp.]